MAFSNGSNPSPAAVKVLVAGGFGAGKTTFVGSVSEIEPLATEEIITSASASVDNLDGLPTKSATTVAFDFGRITIPPGIVLYLFGTPGQKRFWYMWDELSAGAVGAVILADTRRLDACFEAIDFFEDRGIRFLVACNVFDGSFRYDTGEVRAALNLKPHVPVEVCDARDNRSATAMLVRLIQHLIDTTVTVTASPGTPGPA